MADITKPLAIADEQEPDANDPNESTESEINEPSSLSADEQRQKIQKYLHRFRLASDGMASYHKDWNIIDKFDRGKQWDNVSIPVWIPKPITNLIRHVRTTKRANLAMSVPQANFTPLTPLDVPLVKHIQKAYEHVWDEQKVPMLVRKCVDRGLLQGTSIGYVYAEQNIRGKYFGEGHEGNMMYKYDIKTKKLNNANFYIDPTAYELQEAKFFTITENLNFHDVKNDPNFKEFAGDKLAKLEFADLERDNDANGDIYDRPVDKATASLTREIGDEMCTVHIHWERYRNDTGAWQVDVSYFLWNTDFMLYRIEDFKPSIYPIAVLYDEEEDNSFWGTSTAMDMLENQKIINKTAQAASIIGTLHQNPQKVVSRESGINAAEMSRTGTLAGKVWTSNIPADQAVSVIQPPDIPKGLFDIEDRMKADIKDMQGMNEAYQGNSVGSLTTSTGVNDLIDRATIRDRDKSKQIDKFVEDLSMIIVQFIIVYWQEKRPIMTRMKNGQAQFDIWEPLDPMTIENLEYRVHSDVYAKAPLTAAAKSQQADNLMQMQGQFKYDPPIITPEEWIELKDFPNKEDILARMQADRQNKQNQDGQQMQQSIMQIIAQAEQMRAQGLTQDNVDKQIAPMVGQLVAQTFTQGQNQGTEDVMNNAPTGASGAAAANMNQG